MLSKEENELLARVGPGTPCGELLRRYWHPICAAAQLTAEQPKKRVRLLGEDLVVFRLPDGRYGLVEEHCRHRGVSLAYGFCENEGIRCAYHGWLYDLSGRCLEQPFEPKELSFKDRVRLKAYPVEELGGIVFGYMGPPERQTLLPRWDSLVREDGTREVNIRATLNCNWLQPTENIMDSTHIYFLHQYYQENAQGQKIGVDFMPVPMVRYGFQVFEWGILKSVFFGEEKPQRQYARPFIFPTILRMGDEIQWRGPVDDTNTATIGINFKPSRDGKKVEQPEVPVVFIHHKNEKGEYMVESTYGQDAMAWETAGPLYDRTQERLAASDQGVALFRKMLREQIKVVQDGGDPIGLVRDPEKNKMIDVWQWMGTDGGNIYGFGGKDIPPRGKRFEELFDDSRHEVFEVPFGAARRPSDPK